MLIIFTSYYYCSQLLFLLTFLLQVIGFYIRFSLAVQFVLVGYEHICLCLEVDKTAHGLKIFTYSTDSNRCMT